MAYSAASIWSAIAAWFSALAAFSIWRVHRMNMLDAARPEIVLLDWNRIKKSDNDNEWECLRFDSIKNVGKGPAFRIFIRSDFPGNAPSVGMTAVKQQSILPAGEQHDIYGEILMIWKNVENKDGLKYLPIDIEVFSWCSKNYRHKTSYKLMVVQSVEGHIAVGSDEVAPGVILSTRNTTCKPVWFLKLSSKL